MTGFLWFVIGAVVAGAAGTYAYRCLKARDRLASKGITNQLTAVIRGACDYITDPKLAAQLRAEADKADEVWL